MKPRGGLPWHYVPKDGISQRSLQLGRALEGDPGINVSEKREEKSFGEWNSD